MGTRPKRPFKSEHVIDEKISSPELKAYHIGFDQGTFRLQSLVEIIRSVIPEFALGYHQGAAIPLNEVVEKLKEAALTVYDTDKYKSRGEFGELILHLLLRDFHGTIPLISKIYWKDANNVPAHGFDGVHITVNGEEKKLWLGESKLYGDGMAGVTDLIEDLKAHLEADYLRKEFTLISRKLPDETPEIEYWRQLMDKHAKLDTIFNSIVIPMVCTYSSKIFDGYDCECDEYFKKFETECRKLFKSFCDKRPKVHVEVILLLLPVPDKDRLNKEIHSRLKSMQQI